MTAPRRLLDDCFLTDKERMSYGEALTLLTKRLRPVVGVEQLPVQEANGRILAEDVIANQPIPRADNAAVDGYAFRHADYVAGGGELVVAGRVAAGHPLSVPLEVGEAARIFTGAIMPEGADTVAMQEDCTLSADERGVHIPPGLKPGANRRLAGEDQQPGMVVAHSNIILKPQDLSAISSTGLSDISVYHPLRIGLFSTGDEVTRPGQPLSPGHVYDSNFALLSGLLSSQGLSAHDYGVLPDDAQRLEKSIIEAARCQDLILTTGGASRGEEDHLVAIMDKLGHRHIWQLAIKPGRPMMFGQMGDTIVLSLPGNPVAVFVCFLLFVMPALRIMSGGRYRSPTRYPLPACFAIAKKKLDRREFLRGILKTDGNGGLTVDKFPRDGSGLISGLTASDGLIELSEEVTSVKEGDMVSFIPYTEFGLPART